MVRRYLQTMSARDWDGFGELLSEDVCYEMPQTRELIAGREKFVSFNREYPGEWRFAVSRLIADGSTAAGSMNVTVGDAELVGLAFFELQGGLITRVTDFWPEPYEPPAGREHLVDRVPSGPDRLSAP